MQSRRSRAAEGDTMRKIVVLAAIAVLIAAALRSRQRDFLS
jgi:hypothetical protein